MSSDLLLHLDQSLDRATREGLLASIRSRFQMSSTPAHASCRSHLLFVPLDPAAARPHQVLDFVRAQGYSAQIVDL